MSWVSLKSITERAKKHYGIDENSPCRVLVPAYALECFQILKVFKPKRLDWFDKNEALRKITTLKEAMADTSVLECEWGEFYPTANRKYLVAHHYTSGFICIVRCDIKEEDRILGLSKKLRENVKRDISEFKKATEAHKNHFKAKTGIEWDKRQEFRENKLHRWSFDFIKNALAAFENKTGMSYETYKKFFTR